MCPYVIEQGVDAAGEPIFLRTDPVHMGNIRLGVRKIFIDFPTLLIGQAPIPPTGPTGTPRFRRLSIE
jgi:hypothetical protein